MKKITACRYCVPRFGQTTVKNIYSNRQVDIFQRYIYISNTFLPIDIPQYFRSRAIPDNEIYPNTRRLPGARYAVKIFIASTFVSKPPGSIGPLTILTGKIRYSIIWSKRQLVLPRDQPISQHSEVIFQLTYSYKQTQNELPLGKTRAGKNELYLRNELPIRNKKTWLTVDILHI